MLNNILEQIGIDNYIYLSILLFCVGVLGILYRRSTIVMLMSVELMLAAANMLLAVFRFIIRIPADRYSFSSLWR